VRKVTPGGNNPPSKKTKRVRACRDYEEPRVMPSPFNSAVGPRATDELINQLQEQLRSERAQHRFNLAEKEQEIAILLRELAEVRLELARRDGSEAFVRAPSPNTMMH
jgi:hypothetical protein